MGNPFARENTPDPETTPDSIVTVYERYLLELKDPPEIRVRGDFDKCVEVYRELAQKLRKEFPEVLPAVILSTCLIVDVPAKKPIKKLEEALSCKAALRKEFYDGQVTGRGSTQQSQ